jgi:hypothetical protein
MRLGEALGLQHRDWHIGRGDTPFIEVVPRDDPAWARVKGAGARRTFSQRCAYWRWAGFVRAGGANSVICRLSA